MPSGADVFSVPIFFVVFREVIEAAIIISVLLGFVDGLVLRSVKADEDEQKHRKRLVKRMRWQIWAGALVGLGIALCIGAAFIAVFFTTLQDLWSQSEELWEGIFSLIAAIIIFAMALTMLRVDRSKIRWRLKLEKAFEHKGLLNRKKTAQEDAAATPGASTETLVPKSARTEKWALFILPFITVLREALEAVVFVGGVSLGQPATSIPLAAICGIIAGALVGFLIYACGSRASLSVFLVVSTCFLLLIGSGLMSKSVGFFEVYKFNTAVGGDVAEAGNGPGSFDVDGNVWHLTYGNPEDTVNGQGWLIFNSIFGWTNNATVGTILSYVFYWLAVIAALVYMKWQEGRLTKKQREAGAAKRAAAQRDDHDGAAGEKAKDDGSSETHSHEPGAQVIGGSELR